MQSPQYPLLRVLACAVRCLKPRRWWAGLWAAHGGSAVGWQRERERKGGVRLEGLVFRAIGTYIVHVIQAAMHCSRQQWHVQHSRAVVGQDWQSRLLLNVELLSFCSRGRGKRGQGRAKESAEGSCM